MNEEPEDLNICPNGHGKLSICYGQLDPYDLCFKVTVEYCEECHFIGEADANW